MAAAALAHLLDRLVDRSPSSNPTRSARSGSARRPSRRSSPTTTCSGSTRTSSSRRRRARSSSASSSSTGERLGERYFHPFGDHGQDFRGVHFHQLYLRERKRRELDDISAWSMSATAAGARPLRPARPGRAPAFLAAPLRLPFRRRPLRPLPARPMRRRDGVRRIEGKIVDVALDAMNGHVQSVTLADGTTLAGRPVHRLLRLPRPADRAEARRPAMRSGSNGSPATAPWPCPAAIRASPIPSPARPPAPAAGNGGSRSSTGWATASSIRAIHLSDAEAEALLLANLEGERARRPAPALLHRRPPPAGVEPQRRLARPVERLHRAARNRPASTSSRAASSSCSRCSPTGASTRSSATNITARCRTCTRTSATSSSSITRRRGATIPTSGIIAGRWTCPTASRRKIELWRAKGRLFREGRELFGTPSWVAVMLGQGIVPEEHEPAADALDPDMIADALDKMRKSYPADGRAYADARRVHRPLLRGGQGRISPNPSPGLTGEVFQASTASSPATAPSAPAPSRASRLSPPARPAQTSSAAPAAAIPCGRP